MLEIGQQAPAFSGRDQNGQDVRSEDLLAKGPVVLYFYPKDFTPGCTREACMFRDAFEDLQGHGATIVGVSADSGESHKRFAERYQLPFSLLSDPDRKLARDYAIVRPLGLGARRVTFVIGRDGKIRGVFHHEISMSRHVTDVKDLLTRMQGDTSATAAR
ncbi:peroxiredoxin [Sandaracinus amylolyticus]|uniref:thioredoxin-dependent peroxiredoxin n=1 Tax=Sandaracinus amylolyticus TaxID=927083 RepID=A0A0F6SFE6_9BACT|nr:peroxiredoxin [Sandaracinus amylolyticus]AKF06809.1 Thiol peroxidase, Bcp-type [Sandaracinus amylolyticus]